MNLPRSSKHILDSNDSIEPGLVLGRSWASAASNRRSPWALRQLRHKWELEATVGIWDTSIDGVFTFRCHQNWQGGKKKKLYWLVVSTPLKNISQLGWLFPIYGKIKHVPNHQPVQMEICSWENIIELNGEFSMFDDWRINPPEKEWFNIGWIHHDIPRVGFGSYVLFGVLCMKTWEDAIPECAGVAGAVPEEAPLRKSQQLQKQRQEYQNHLPRPWEVPRSHFWFLGESF